MDKGKRQHEESLRKTKKRTEIKKVKEIHTLSNDYNI